MLPPKWVRRIVIAPIAWLVVVGLAAALPPILLIALIASLFGSGRRRAPRVLWMIEVYLVLEAIALVVLLGLWLGAGLGWKIRTPAFQRVHYVLTGRYLRVLYAQARWALRVRVDVTGAAPDEIGPGRPELVFCRHAGPGDSFLLIHALVNWFDREPRIVLKDTLQWDPVIDVMLNRLPNLFITVRNRGQDAEDLVATLAADLDENDALVLFPEGGNFTPSRRLRAIERLRRLGLHTMADRAERMRHVLAPRPGGTLAALDAAPGAQVVWVAHTGVDRMLTVADVWRELPLETTITMRWWAVPAAEVPDGYDQRVEWLYDWWAKIDQWIEEHR
jgi:1-acyl-sn-glycerol-3-phosphate acyltransferase